MHWAEEFEKAVDRQHILGVTFWVNKIGERQYQLNARSNDLPAELKQQVFEYPSEATLAGIRYLRERFNR